MCVHTCAYDRKKEIEIASAHTQVYFVRTARNVPTKPMPLTQTFEQRSPAVWCERRLFNSL